MQPYHAIDDGRWAEKRIGPERIKTTYAFRSLLDRRRTCSPSAPTGPWRRSIRCSASTPPSPGGRSTARTRTAGCREQKITVEEALRAYTGGRRLRRLRRADRRGKLAPGYLADLVLLDRDLTRIPPEEIEQAAVQGDGGRRACRLHKHVTLNEVKGTIPSMAPFAALRVTLGSTEPSFVPIRPA